MTKKEYVALIKKRLDMWLKWDPGVPSVNQQVAEDLAAHIWSPEEVARAALEASAAGGISFEQAVKALSDFIKETY